MPDSIGNQQTRYHATVKLLREGHRRMYFAAKWTNPRTTAKDLEKVMKERASRFAAGLTQQRQNSSQNRKSVLSDKMVFKEDSDPKCHRLSQSSAQSKHSSEKM